MSAPAQITARVSRLGDLRRRIEARLDASPWLTRTLLAPYVHAMLAGAHRVIDKCDAELDEAERLLTRLDAILLQSGGAQRGR